MRNAVFFDDNLQWWYRFLVSRGIGIYWDESRGVNVKVNYSRLRDGGPIMVAKYLRGTKMRIGSYPSSELNHPPGGGLGRQGPLSLVSIMNRLCNAHLRFQQKGKPRFVWWR